MQPILFQGGTGHRYSSKMESSGVTTESSGTWTEESLSLRATATLALSSITDEPARELVFPKADLLYNSIFKAL